MIEDMGQLLESSIFVRGFYICKKKNFKKNTLTNFDFDTDLCAYVAFIQFLPCLAYLAYHFSLLISDTCALLLLAHLLLVHVSVKITFLCLTFCIVSFIYR